MAPQALRSCHSRTVYNRPRYMLVCNNATSDRRQIFFHIRIGDGSVCAYFQFLLFMCLV